MSEAVEYGPGAAHFRVGRDQERVLDFNWVANVILDFGGVTWAAPHAADVVVVEDRLEVLGGEFDCCG